MQQRMHLWLVCMVLLCFTLSASAEFDAQAFPDRDDMAAVMGRVAVPSDNLPASSLQTTTSPSLRGSPSESAAAEHDERDALSSATGSQDDRSSSILPGRNGFGHVSYDSSTPASAGSSSSAAAAADTRARIRHAGKVASAMSPDNLLKLRAAF
ncbi:hypothetical protein FI667_g4748, partial [Globisporangium splendens]